MSWNGVRQCSVLALTGTFLAIVAVAVVAPSARADVSWLCRPGVVPDPCMGDLTTTIRAPGSPDRVETPAVDSAPPIDCFYVYPTVSQQPTVNADKTADDEVRAIAVYQAQRFSSVCRVFAPLYRQETLNGLAVDTAAKQKPHYDEPVADAPRRSMPTCVTTTAVVDSC